MYPKFRKYLPIISIGAILLLVGCNNGMSASPASENTISQAPTVADISFDQFGQIPKAGANKKFAIGLHNTTGKKLALKNIRVINPLTGRLDNTLATIDSSECIMLNEIASCKLGISSHLLHSASFLLEAEFNDVNGQSHTASQLIRYNERIEATNGLAFENDFYDLTTTDGKYQLALPVVITEAFDNLTVTNGNLACDNGYQAGSSCTYFANGKITGTHELVGLKLAAFRGGQEVASKTSSIYTTIANAGNLLITQPADLHIAEDALESATSVTLYNSGNAPVSNIKISAEDKLSYQAGDCGTTLESHARCTFEVKVNSEFSGSDILTIDYQRTADGSNNGHLAVNVYYLKKDSAFGIQMRTYAGNLVNTQVFTNATQDIVVKNSGVATHESLIYQLYPVEKSFSVTPVDLDTNIKGCGNKLVANQECGLRISYTPEEETIGTFQYKLNLNVTFRSPSGTNKVTAMVKHQEPYSARFHNVAINFNRQIMMMGLGDLIGLTAILDYGQTELSLTTLNGELSQSSCLLDALAQPICRFQLNSYQGNPNYNRWDPASVDNSNDPDKPAVISLPLVLNATTTNDVTVNKAKSPVIINESIGFIAPYIYLPAPTEGASSNNNTGITWGTGGIVSSRFEVNGDCVTDNLTGLMWAKDGDLLGKGTWGDSTTAGTAQYKIAQMNTNSTATAYHLCGYSDWHLPTINELSSLVNYAEIEQAIWLNSQGFTNVQKGNYWSSTVYSDSSYAAAWFLKFGRVGSSSPINSDFNGGLTTTTTTTYSVWPVRGGQ